MHTKLWWNFRVSRRGGEYQHSYDEGSKHLWNVGDLLPDYTEQHLIRKSSQAKLRAGNLEEGQLETDGSWGYHVKWILDKQGVKGWNGMNW
jgi:hypothetical protein